ncbi:hypothetical protein FACS189443_6500 [Planctomycetales bacterium]|nr:hypothetical protein FACS189443_6500 [Planctomycetales bacterium]
MRELTWMVRGKLSSEWDQVAPLLCAAINPWTKTPISIEQIHPYRKAKGKVMTSSNKHAWKQLTQSIKGKR